MSMIATLTFALALQPTAPSSADADASARVDTPAPKGVSAVYEFDNDNVDGDTLTPTGVEVPAAHQIRFPSMIRVRGTFVREMIQMANDV